VTLPFGGFFEKSLGCFVLLNWSRLLLFFLSRLFGRFLLRLDGFVLRLLLFCFRLLLLLLLLMSWSLVGEGRLSSIFAESNVSKHANKGVKLKNQVRVSAQITQLPISCLFVNHDFKGVSKSAYQESISKCQRMANKEVAQLEMGFKHRQSLLELIESDRVSLLVARCLVEHVIKHARGSRDHVRVDVVNPLVNLTL